MTGDWLKQERLSKGWSQQKLAKLLNVTQQAVSNYEKGTRQLTVEKINKLKLIGIFQDANCKVITYTLKGVKS